ncbi:hypothetical protein [Actinomadura opuntiae]|uniref:hypothetical protein n=1 Tax=Actinomadura sp. OS1-43 TaxID=604315 RepID=UPI00255AF05E|nr:hypothetical protein [Actinomadura sp. OS1-43]MDL4815974.1 hypothetical protein [Actinomadura sp. OS1-43]
MSVLLDTDFLTWTNKGTGVAVAFVGALVVSPDGTRWFGRWTWRKVTFWRRRHHHGHAQLSAAFEASGSVYAVVNRSWPDDTPSKEQFRRIREWLNDIEHNIGKVEVDLAKHKRDTTNALKEATQKHEAGLQELRSLLRQMEASAARIDGRALPVIGWGIVLSGVPEVLAKSPWATYIVCLLSTVVTIWVAVSVIRDYCQANRQLGRPAP